LIAVEHFALRDIAGFRSRPLFRCHWALDTIRNDLIWLLVLIIVIVLIALPKFFKK